MNTAETVTDQEKIIEVLRPIDIFKELDENELDNIAAISEITTYHSGDVILSSSKAARFLFIMMEGSVHLTIKGGRYKTLKPNEVFGEIGIVNEFLRTGEARAVGTVKVIRVCGTRLLLPDHVSAGTGLKIMKALARRISNYLIAREQLSTQELIERGEGEFIEFKSSLRMNLRSGKRDPEMEKAVLKTLAAFLNSKGGTLLIGVDDDKQIIGIEIDRFPNHDRYLLHLTNLMKKRIGSFHLKFIHFEMVEVEGKFVLRLDVNASTMPAYYVSGDEEQFFVRTGPSTTAMRLSKVYDFIVRRFVSTAAIKKQ